MDPNAFKYVSFLHFDNHPMFLDKSLVVYTVPHESDLKSKCRNNWWMDSIRLSNGRIIWTRELEWEWNKNSSHLTLISICEIPIHCNETSMTELDCALSKSTIPFLVPSSIGSLIFCGNLKLTFFSLSFNFWYHVFALQKVPGAIPSGSEGSSSFRGKDSKSSCSFRKDYDPSDWERDGP